MGPDADQSDEKREDDGISGRDDPSPLGFHRKCRISGNPSHHERSCAREGDEKKEGLKDVEGYRTVYIHPASLHDVITCALNLKCLR